MLFLQIACCCYTGYLWCDERRCRRLFVLSQPFPSVGERRYVTPFASFALESYGNFRTL